MEQIKISDYEMTKLVSLRFTDLIIVLFLTHTNIYLLFKMFFIAPLLFISVKTTLSRSKANIINLTIVINKDRKSML